MSQITIIPSDGIVGVGGVFHQVDLADIDQAIHAVQFNTATGSGHVEYTDPALPNKPIGKTAFRMFEKFVNRWKAADAPPVRTLEDVKRDCRSQINAERDTREQAGFPYLDKVLDSDAKSVQRISITVQAAQAAMAVGQPFSVDWTCQDNTTLTMDAAQVMGMPVALALYAKQLHEHAQTRKAEIDAATTIEDAESVHWDLV